VLVAFIVNIIAIVLALFSKKKDSKWLKRAFFVIFIFLAIRYGYGNDYMGYLRYFLDVNQYVYGFSTYINNLFDFDAYSGLREMEVGWMFICKLFQPFGFFAMVAILSGFYCFIYYKIINDFVPPSYYWFSVLIFVFDPQYVLIQASAMRQSVAIVIFITSFYFLKRRNIIKYGSLIYLSSLFHKSSLVNIPVYLLVIKNNKITIKNIIIIVLIYVFMIVAAELLNNYFGLFLARYFDDYSVYEMNTGKLRSGIGVIYFLFIIIIILYHSMKESGDILLFNKIAVLSLIIGGMSAINIMISRITYYYIFALLIAIPYTVYKIENKILRIGVMTSYVLYVILMWYSHFYSPVWHDAYFEYHTIFESPKIY
jgi:hypothetical protein